MNSNAPISGQVASQPSSQMPGLPQRINNSMASQMQNLDSRKMDPEFMQLRRKMQQKIYNTLQKKNQSNDWLRKLPEIVRHLEECMFRDNATKDEYLTLYMESNENHFFSIIKSIISSKHRAPHQVRASSTPSMMIPTPGMQQDRSTQSIVSGSVENPKMGGPSVECLPSTNMGNLQPTGNGLTDVNTPFNLANVSNGQQRQGTNFPLGSVVRNVMHSNSAGVPRQSSQMIPTPGYIDPQAVSLASGSSNATNLSSDESTVPLELQQKRNIGNPSNHLLHSLGGQIDSGIRPSTLQKALLHSMSNGVVNGGLDSVGSNMQFKRSTNLEGLLKTGPPNVPPKPLQQHFDQQIHQPRMPVSLSEQMLSNGLDAYSMKGADVSGSNIIHGPGSSALSALNNLNNGSLQMRLRTNPGMLYHQTSLNPQHIQIRPHTIDPSHKLNVHGSQSTNEVLQSHSEVQQSQQQASPSYTQFLQNQNKLLLQQQQQQQQQGQQNQKTIPSDPLRQTSGISLDEQMPGHGLMNHSEAVHPQVSQQTLPSESQSQCPEVHPKAQFANQLSGSQDFHVQILQGPHKSLQPNDLADNSQRDINNLSSGSLTRDQFQLQPSQGVQLLDKLSIEEPSEFRQKITVKDEVQQPHISLQRSNALSATTMPHFSGGLAPGLEGSIGKSNYLKQIRWLLFLHHARRCPSPKGQCPEVYCLRVQELITHIRSCNSDSCEYARCKPSRGLLQHFHYCRAADCLVCVPVRRFMASCRRPVRALSDAGSESQADAANTTSKGRDAIEITGDMESKPSKIQLTGALSEAASVSQIDADNNRIKRDAVIAELSDDKQAKCRKIQRVSLLVTDNGSSAALHSSKDPSHGFQEAQLRNCKQTDVVMPTKCEIPDTKTERYISTGHEKLPIYESNIDRNQTKMIDMKSNTSNHVKCNVKQETLMVEEEIDQAKNYMKQESFDKPIDQATASKSGKPKIKGVSLTELFTPEQIRDHIHSLRRWDGQSKAKAEKNQAMEHTMNENSCQLCAVEKLTFDPPPIYCSTCGARIKRNAMYYTVGSGETRHYFCIPCYNEARGDTIAVEGSTFLKAKLEKKKNDEETEEWWVQCDKCEAWQHQICALFNGRRNERGQAEYTCPNCNVKEIENGERKPLPQSAVLGAKDLPTTILSDHIEQRLFRRLKQERMDRARLLGKNTEEVPGAEGLVVRVVSSVDKNLEVKQRFLEIFQEENYPTEFPYKSKAVLLFQKIEGVEVCLFAMYVQEFGSECSYPNQRRVYLSYLDSVKYFRPDTKSVTGEALRTVVYHEILIGYLEYCKKRGFTSCYIWACPPLKGEDYILYCHPEIQKTPKSDKLREWYLAMLRKATKENVVVDVTNLYDHFFMSTGDCKAKVTAARLPYFDGDYWPGAAEDMISQLCLEDDGKKQQKRGKTKNTISKRALKAAGHTDLSGNVSKDALLMQKLGETIYPMKEDFIMVHLQHACTHCCVLMVSGVRWVCNQCKNFQLCDKCHEVEMRLDEREKHPVSSRDKHVLHPIEINDVAMDTKDEDEILESEFFDTRQAFLSLCQGNHYQYDTLRRAKHSSMMVLYHLHNPTAPAFVTTCNVCQHDIETGQGWRCETCPEFDVCNGCYQKGGINHPHKLTNHPSTAERDAQNKEARQNRVLQLRKMLDLLVHASQCRFPQCQYPNCRKVKSLFRHGIQCKIRASGGCPLCKRMWYLLQLHARACNKSECSVPRCRDLREHLRRLQQQSESRRRAAVMEMMRQRAAEVARNSS
ncbi:probable histone acetyltransferase HAC-like 1 isoform X1 [Zingiber officinale]|uniref:probable histone acetyltransferase HAC-like 1 isoform X1 n=2 Tax=Zingiber officinale TaxID=94328 RepID=UPI001C4AF447|nr:probable histone acetyltransferase HAC-like 1 isoform X1 [Zingiber officinale]